MIRLFGVVLAALAVSGEVGEVMYPGEVGEVIYPKVRHIPRVTGEGRTALDEYVARADNSYSYFDTGKKIKLLDGLATGHVLNMTSQNWLTPQDSSQPVWWHSVVVIEPKDLLKHDKGFLWITGGSNEHPHYPSDPTDEDLLVTSIVAVNTGAVGVVVYQIPNEPISFPKDVLHKHRTEDSIISFTWMHYLNDTSSPDWLLRLPMTKGAVRAMDTAQDYLLRKHSRAPTHFVVAGASKRGWTTWTTAAVDQRVEGAIPIVMDLVGMQAGMHNMWRNYGAWTFAFDDYYHDGMTSRLDDPNFQSMADIIDPMSYADRYTFPIMAINSGDDEFFQIDDDRTWWGKLPGDKYRIMCQNAEHSVATAVPEVLTSAISFSENLWTGYKMPQFTWELDEANGNITVTFPEGSMLPDEAYLRHARTFSTTRRDFRWIKKAENANGTCHLPDIALPHPILGSRACLQPIIWTTKKIKIPKAGTYSFHRDIPKEGWEAFLLEFYFKSSAAFPSDQFKLTTQAAVIPARQPFPDCDGARCKGTLV